MGNKLELTWLGKEKEIKIEPRILIENKELSNTEHDSETENMLIHGDNLLALKALESKYAGQVKCIYIDPPFNTGTRINADGEEIGYNDNLEHSIWLSLIRSRLQYLKVLMRDDGVIFVHLDDKEAAYCKVLLDEVFGRKNYINTIVMTTNDPSGFKSTSNKIFSTANYLFVYAKNSEKLNLKKIYIEKDYDTAYSKIILNINENYKNWKIQNLRDYVCIKNGFDDYKDAKKSISKELVDIWVKNYALNNPEQIIRTAAIGGGARKKRNETIEMSKNNRNEVFVHPNEDIDNFYIINGEQILFYKDRFKLIDGKSKPSQSLTDVWTDISWTGIAKEGNVIFKNSKKPEHLISRIINLATEDNDYVLDSFLGSATTVAVAHKMNRRWIGIEMANHAYTHCKVRLDKVIDGSDQGGISKSVNWNGGGGYKFYELAPSLINKDDFGEYIINKEYDADMLASAVALHEGFSYEPDNTIFWKQSKGNENSYLFVTTRHLTSSYIDSIESTMEDGEYLIIACKSFESGIDKLYSNITIKKIPQMLLSRCEFDKENYNLNIINPPIYDYEEELEYE